MSLHAQGQSGSVRCGGRIALELAAWSLSPEGPAGGWRVQATVKEANPLWLTGGPYDLRLTVGQGEWRFRDVQLAPDAEYRMTAITGTTPPEE